MALGNFALIRGRTVIVLFILTNLVYGIMIFWSIPMVSQYAEGMRLLDMQPFGYDHNYASELFSLLGEEGRNKYLSVQIPVDMIYPFLFGFTYFALFSWLLSKIGLLKSKWYLLSLLPVIAAIFDYIENMGIIYLLNTYPDISEISVGLTSVGTVIKSIATTLYFSSFLVFFFYYLFRRIRTLSSHSAE